MPLISSKREWEKWVKEHTGKIRRRGKEEPYVYVRESPKNFPCWLCAVYCVEDCQVDYWDCEFIYQDSGGGWDLEDYENRLSWER